MPARTVADDVKLYLFGAPLIERRGSPVAVDRQKAIALLAYLVVTGRRHHRDVLAGLLWPELDQARARAGLRRVLQTLRAVIGFDRVIADRESIGLRWSDALWADVAAFQQRMADSRLHGVQCGLDPTGQMLLEEAVALYRADLLAGFNLRDAPEFENWLCLERETLRRAVITALEMLVKLHIAHSNFGPALDFAQRWLALDPADERVHQALIDLYRRTNDPVAARRQYELCVRMLAEEIGVAPSVETRQLVDRLGTGASPDVSQVTAHVVPKETCLPCGGTRLATVLVTGLGPLPDLNDTFGPASDAALQRQEHFIQAALEILLRCGAYVAPSLGDKIMAVFGIPTSHEDDPERAVRAAFDLQRITAPDATTATGIHTGMIYVQGGPAGEQGFVILGSAVDTALRLYTGASAGEILVTSATQRLTQGVAAYSAYDITLAGIRSSTPVLRADRLQAHPRKVRGVPGLRSALVGRDLELAQLRAAVQQMQTTTKGCFLVISGSAGVGKSRLVAEMHDQLVGDQAAHLAWLEGRCCELTNDVACGPFRDILREFSAIDPDADNEAIARRFLSQIAMLWREATLPATQLSEVTPFLANLLSLRLPAGYVSMNHLAPEEAHFRTVEALVAFVLALSRRQPTLLVLEDLHWADAHSLRVVERLAAQLGATPLAICCVLRPEPDPLNMVRQAAQACPTEAVELNLTELAVTESRSLVEQLLQRSPLPPELDGLVLARAEGNPFFLEETLRTLIDDAILVRHDEGWSVDTARMPQLLGMAAGRVPDAVQGVLLSRIDRQPAHLRKILQTAAVIGREAPIALLGQLLPAGATLLPALAALEKDGFLETDPAHLRTQVRFHHALQQAAAYQTIGSNERRAHHGQVAAAIEALWPMRLDDHAEQLAYHYSRSDNVTKAVEYLLKAGARARNLFLNSVAISSFSQAVALHGQLPEEEARRMPHATILAALGAVQHTAGKHVDAARNLKQAIDEGLATGLAAPDLARWTYWLADSLYWCLDYYGVLDVCTRAFALLPIEPDSLESVLLNQQMAGAHLSLGEPERFCAISLQTAKFIRHLPFCEELTSPYHHVIDACLAQKEVDRAWEFITALRNQAQAVGNLRALAKAEFIAARTCSETGRFVEAIARGEAALALAEKTGDTAIKDFCLGRLASDALLLGRDEDAKRYATLHHRLALDAGALGAESLMLAGRIHLGLGHTQVACDLLEQSLAISAAAGYAISPEANLWLGRAYQRLNRREEAILQFRVVLQLSRPSAPSPPYMPDAKPVAVQALGALDELLANQERFAALWRPLVDGLWQAEPFFTHPDLLPIAAPVECWPRLTPIDPADPAWRWEDSCGDCRWSTGPGFVKIEAAAGRDLWWTNFTAPQLVRKFAGDFGLQVRCAPVDDQTPAMGGLLLWLDERNFLRLDRGSGGRHELRFMGCLGGVNAVIGRGHLSGSWVELRLIRKGADVTARCRGAEGGWYSIGSATFAAGPVAAGIFAVGLVDRTLYPKLDLSSAQMRFE